jgi:hypothetical protein
MQMASRLAASADALAATAPVDSDTASVPLSVPTWFYSVVAILGETSTLLLKSLPRPDAVRLSHAVIHRVLALISTTLLHDPRRLHQHEVALAALQHLCLAPAIDAVLAACARLPAVEHALLAADAAAQTRSPIPRPSLASSNLRSRGFGRFPALSASATSLASPAPSPTAAAATGMSPEEAHFVRLGLAVHTLSLSFASALSLPSSLDAAAAPSFSARSADHKATLPVAGTSSFVAQSNPVQPGRDRPPSPSLGAEQGVAGFLSPAPDTLLSPQTLVRHVQNLLMHLRNWQLATPVLFD